MHPANAFAIVRIARDYARWRAVPDDKRSDMPAWWWGPALAVREDCTPLPNALVSAFGLPDGANYADAARMMLASLGTQAHQPWPEHFPRTSGPHTDDPAPSAEPAAQAASAAAVPIA